MKTAIKGPHGYKGGERRNADERSALVLAYVSFRVQINLGISAIFTEVNELRNKTFLLTL